MHLCTSEIESKLSLTKVVTFAILRYRSGTNELVEEKDVSTKNSTTLSGSEKDENLNEEQPNQVTISFMQSNDEHSQS